MKSKAWARLKPIFDRAVEMEGTELERFVEEACAGDAELLGELRKLLDGDTALFISPSQ